MSKFSGSSLDEVYGPGQITGASEADFHNQTGQMRAPTAPTGFQNTSRPIERYSQGSLEGAEMPMPAGNIGSMAPDNFSGRPQQRLPQTQNADAIQAAVFGSDLVPNGETFDLPEIGSHRKSETSCNRESLRGTLVIPAQTLAQYAQAGQPMDIEILFDASGPFVGYSLTGTSIRGDVPLKPASLQREIYYKGQRYWSKWFNSEFANGSKKKYWLYGFVVIIIAIAILGTVYYIVKKNKTPLNVSAPKAVPVSVPSRPRPITTLDDIDSLI